ncbi:hypothetical protein OJF2_65530 [Aquisphaera giovannonii]|uniref:Methane oxygenase PmoA n=2 Tax=Aquisphaera giovannonii TaxID=406548 RepID=A0A5B9WBR6_9BACT|nr:hypothetical protein OJF2_65530 [Aquisphaera giovannonii]
MTALLLLLATSSLGPEPTSGTTWRQTDRSLALVTDGCVVWQFNLEDNRKPCFHPLTIGGGPSFTDFRPKDHPWHRALWFSWKEINKVTYWDEDPTTGRSPGVTEVTGVTFTPNRDNSARIALEASYHPPGQPAVLTEHRELAVSAPETSGAYHIDWQSRFTAGASDVVLDRTPIQGEPNGASWGGYAGLSLRLSPTLKTWQFSDRDGPVKALWKRATWMAFSGSVDGGKSASIVVLEHPSSFRHPTPWYLISDMPYFSPAVIYLGPHTLAAGQSLNLRYRILLQPQAANAVAIEAAWRKYASEP